MNRAEVMQPLFGPGESDAEKKLGVQATWRSTSCVDPATGSKIVVSFTTERGIVRYQLDLESARHLSETLAEMLAGHAKRTNSQSATSAGSPRVSVSTPDDGVKV